MATWHAPPRGAAGGTAWHRATRASRPCCRSASEWIKSAGKALAGAEVATSAALRRGRTTVPASNGANSGRPQVGPELAVPTGGKWLCAGGAFRLPTRPAAATVTAAPRRRGGSDACGVTPRKDRSARLQGTCPGPATGEGPGQACPQEVSSSRGRGLSHPAAHAAGSPLRPVPRAATVTRSPRPRGGSGSCGATPRKVPIACQAKRFRRPSHR
jgi:hypothetical protein